jgi:ribonuclease HII
MASARLLAYRKLSDLALAAKARTGDAAALHALVERHGPRVNRLAAQLMSDLEDAIAMRRAITRLIRRSALAPLPTLPGCPACDAGLPYRIIIDGLPLPEIGYAHEALIDGDARCQSISAAAILAKTVRDRLMHRLAARHPGYGWHTNVGYGTEEHQEGLRVQGPTRHHRLTFAPLAQLTLSL